MHRRGDGRPDTAACTGNNRCPHEPASDDYHQDKTTDPFGQAHTTNKVTNPQDYDVATLGNHEFNFGLDFLRRAIAGAQLPAVSANVVLPDGKRPSAKPRRQRPAPLATLMCLPARMEYAPAAIVFLANQGFTPNEK